MWVRRLEEVAGGQVGKWMLRQGLPTCANALLLVLLHVCKCLILRSSATEELCLDNPCSEREQGKGQQW